MIKTISQLKRGFESSCYKTPEFSAFCRTFKSEFKKVLAELGCTDLECHNGHFDISGFFNSPNGQIWYFRLDDVRWMGEIKLLVRTAQHRRDFRGGRNNNLSLDILSDQLKEIINC